jgi:hypothetical protein
MWHAQAGIGSTFSFYRKTTGTHNIDATQATYLLGHLQANF